MVLFCVRLAVVPCCSGRGAAKVGGTLLQQKRKTVAEDTVQSMQIFHRAECHCGRRSSDRMAHAVGTKGVGGGELVRRGRWRAVPTYLLASRCLPVEPHASR